jgi:hypothetical protein
MALPAPKDAPITNGHPHGSPHITMANSRKTSPQKKTLPVEPNVQEVVLGNGWIKPWFPSFYPEDLVGRKLETLYVCQWCFKYTKDLVPYLGHGVCVSSSPFLWVGLGV